MSAVLISIVASAAPRTCGAADGEALDQANRRWTGASCRNRHPIPLKGGVDRHGVTLSWWIPWGVEDPTKVQIVRDLLGKGRFHFSNGDALLRRYESRWIPRGTEFRALGWARDESSGAPYLEVELRGLPVRGKVFCYKPTSNFGRKLKMDRFGDCERWARLELFDITSAPDEELVEVDGSVEPSGTTTGPGSTLDDPRVGGTAGTTATGSRSPEAVFDPEVVLHAVAVQPARVSAGEEMLLVVSYEVAGLPPGAAFQLTEVRRLMTGERELTSFREELARRNGSYTSRLPVRVPPGMGTGMYTVEATVELSGARSTGTAFFQVVNHGR